ncbi:hypothetical protein HAALTHF_18030n [Vreelandella aquamarina]|nr:hypothetical protein HAALTHF_18030n [Halomonas axialensis]
MSSIRLTQYSHGAGCGCKIAPDVLDGILAKAGPAAGHQRLIVGNQGVKTPPYTISATVAA